MDQVGPGQTRALEHQSVLELLQTVAERTLRFPDADFWGNTHSEHSPSDGVPGPTSSPTALHSL